MSAAADERVVLLDEQGRAVGSAAKRAVHHAATPLHLAFSCYVFAPNGDVLVTRRASHKPTWGGVWTNSFCGHPSPGESLVAAVTRRASRELGIAVEGVRLVLPAFRYRAVMADGTVENEMCPVYVATTRDAVSPDVEEVGAFAWMPWDAFRRRALAADSELSPWCLEQVAALPADPAGAPAAAEGDLPPAARA